MTTTHHARNDFNHDGRSDILWRHDSGLLTDWLGTANGGFVTNWPNSVTDVSSSYGFSNVVGTGDFNGDGREDLLVGATGATTPYINEAIQLGNGSFYFDFQDGFPVAAGWSVLGTGDFNGDGRTDVLWRSSSGIVTDWLYSPTAGHVGDFDTFGVTVTQNWANAHYEVPPEWEVVGIADFNNDAKADLLWRNVGGQINEWLGQSDGGFSDNSSNVMATVATTWSVVGTGDFNGDGFADILWKNVDGIVTDWLGRADGGFNNNWNASENFAGSGWHVADTGDYNGDGRDDILWRNDNGLLTDWLGTGTGGFIDNSVNASSFADLSWHVIPQSPVSQSDPSPWVY